MAFHGVGTGVLSVPMPNTVAMGPAVPGGVRSLLLSGVICALPMSSSTSFDSSAAASASALGLGSKLLAESLDLVSEVGVGGGKGGVGGDQLLKDSLLVCGGAG